MFSYLLVSADSFLYAHLVKILLVFSLLLLASNSWGQTCDYGTNQCNAGQACIKLNPEHAECRSLPLVVPTINFPVSAIKGIYCDQGNLSPNGNSHAYTNTAFALDLTSNRQTTAGQVFASSSGLIITNYTCFTQNDQCGNGFGNYVEILRDDGVLVFHAHLDEVYVKSGDVVSRGDKIGLEGNTGWTGKDNRHLHFSVHYDWRIMGFDYYKNNIGFLPNSIPFKINACQPGQHNCSDTFIDSRNLKCTRVTNTIDWLQIL
ncbi:MAG: hypothetical protein A2X86_12780 [Bdellovibrionales bacterium GWA2_49_15]|nr:MAG: hypothetical protein A2X86_12780 [Bdellovibrionales bacterium GWA2_49_15]HAZ14728.1 hypothetical protein [Bdellovibrionales bacterium]